MILFGPVPSASESFLQIVVLVGFGLFGIGTGEKIFHYFDGLSHLGKHGSNIKKEKERKNRRQTR
ncbi:hypothetical protein SAMN05421858_2962 [Haladaptatus litoreus]|uniref:Uncharacterized protein n=1 Tax=Haladaptatus litoreus TaxID=553468 RepID=A0A1N7C4K1_9EURY|nr:hypothetical protein SAMN05421858_2962 [Haladaptatus litoreus]